jgi:hypothetical protein
MFTLSQKEAVIRLAALVLGAAVMWYLATRKNHNPWVWGGVGAVSAAIAPILLLVALLALGVSKFRCAKCHNPLSNKDAIASTCPHCGEVWKPDIAARPNNSLERTREG